MANNKEQRECGHVRALQTRPGGHGAARAQGVRNDRVARRNRDYLDLHGVTAINLVSTPRAGKTSLLESTIPALTRDYRIAVVASDLHPTRMFAGCVRWACRRSR